ncbi:MAG: outer membrane lipoprotein-sorting protein [Betaproteobacteria bacterium]
MSSRQAPAAVPAAAGAAGAGRRRAGVGPREQVRHAALLLLMATVVARVPAGAAADNARQIVEEAQRRTEANSERYEGLLQVFDAKGRISDKRWIFERIGSHGRSKSILRFTAPAEVKGVALLVVNHPDRASDQWMWTPAIERDRRIALQDRSTRFFGTDFSFEDLEERDVDQYDYELLGDDVVDGAACWKIQSTPKETKSSQYTRSIVWIRKDNYAFARIENYIRGEVVRRLAYRDIRNVQGIWTARELEMADLRRGSRTRLTLDKLAYNVPMRDEDFTLEALRRQ